MRFASFHKGGIRLQVLADVRRPDLLARLPSNRIGTVANSVPELRDSYQDAWSALHLGKRLARHKQLFQIGEFRVQELLLTVSYTSRKRFLQALLHP